MNRHLPQARARETRTAKAKHIQRINANDLLIAGMKLADAAGLHISPSRISRVVKRALNRGGYAVAQNAMLELLNGTWRGSWEDFELVVNGYADPTGATAARNVDLSRAEVR